MPFRSLAGVRIWSLSLGLGRQATVGRQGECGPLPASPAALLAGFGRRADTPSGGLGWRPDQALRSSGYKTPTFLSFETRNVHPTSSLLQTSGAGQGLAARGRAVLWISGSTSGVMLGCGGDVSSNSGWGKGLLGPKCAPFWRHLQLFTSRFLTSLVFSLASGSPAWRGSSNKGVGPALQGSCRSNEVSAGSATLRACAGNLPPIAAWIQGVAPGLPSQAGGNQLSGRTLEDKLGVGAVAGMLQY